MKVAVYSPLPPQRSGIADYTAELLPALAVHAELEIVVEPDWRLAPELSRWPQRPVAELPAALASGAVDVALYHVGNSADYHERIWETALCCPGVVVLHEYVLHHLVRGIAERRRDPGLLVRELAAVYGSAGERAGERARSTQVPLDPFRWPLFERLVDSSLAVLVHSEHARDRVRRSRPQARVAVVPFHLSLPDAIVGSAEARRRLGLPAESPLLGLFGHIVPTKRPQVILAALERLRQRLPDLRLLVAGEVSPHFAGSADLARTEGVEVLGRLELERFSLAMQAVDVAVNLRYPVAGETSGTLIRLLGLGTPVVVSDAGSFTEIPDDCCAKIPLDESEVETLVETVAALLARPALRAAMGANARRWVVAHHDLAISAQGYATLLRETVASGVRVEHQVAEPTLPSRQPLGEQLVARVGRELADLGLDERDEQLMERVASAVAEIGWGSRR